MVGLYFLVGLNPYTEHAGASFQIFLGGGKGRHFRFFFWGGGRDGFASEASIINRGRGVVGGGGLL